MASVGIYRGEKDSRQEIMLNLAAEVGEPADDRNGETIDYRALVREAQKLRDEGLFQLIETSICELGRRLVSHARVPALAIALYKTGEFLSTMASGRHLVSQQLTTNNTT